MEQFNEGKQVNTIKGFRSAIAAFHTGFEDGSTVSNNTALSQLIQGMFVNRPVVRRLSPPWNMTLVLETLARPPFEPLRDASLRAITIKTAFLLAAASLRRRSALHALTLEKGHINFENGGVRLLPDPSFIAKNQTLEFLPESIFLRELSAFSSVPEDRFWCPVRALKAYIKATQNLRGDTTALFVSLNAPHGRVSRETISRWISLAITANPDAVITGERVHAHQVRALASSLAFFKRVPLKEILAAAVWKTPTTFISAYLRNMVPTEGAAGAAVLSASTAPSSH